LTYLSIFGFYLAHLSIRVISKKIVGKAINQTELKEMFLIKLLSL